MSITPSARQRHLVALLATSLLFLAACSSGSSDADGTTTTQASTTTADDVTTTTADGGGDTTTTASEDPVDGPTSDDLDAILPTADDLGDGWAVDTSADEDDGSESDRALEEQCPEAAALTQGDEEDEGDEVEVSFTDADDASVDVKLTPSAKQLSDDELQQAVDAINACGEISVQGDDGTTTTLSFEAVADDTYGEQGVRLQAGVSIQVPEAGDPIALTLYALFFRNGPVGVSITGADGLDTTALEAIPIDTDVLVGVADDLDAAVADLVG